MLTGNIDAYMRNKASAAESGIDVPLVDARRSPEKISGRRLRLNNCLNLAVSATSANVVHVVGGRSGLVSAQAGRMVPVVPGTTGTIR